MTIRQIRSQPKHLYTIQLQTQTPKTRKTQVQWNLCCSDLPPSRPRQATIWAKHRGGAGQTAAQHQTKKQSQMWVTRTGINCSMWVVCCSWQVSSYCSRQQLITRGHTFVSLCTTWRKKLGELQGTHADMGRTHKLTLNTQPSCCDVKQACQIYTYKCM